MMSKASQELIEIVIIHRLDNRLWSSKLFSSELHKWNTIVIKNLDSSRISIPNFLLNSTILNFGQECVRDEVNHTFAIFFQAKPNPSHPTIFLPWVHTEDSIFSTGSTDTISRVSNF